MRRTGGGVVGMPPQASRDSPKCPFHGYINIFSPIRIEKNIDQFLLDDFKKPRTKKSAVKLKYHVYDVGFVGNFKARGI